MREQGKPQSWTPRGLKLEKPPSKTGWNALEKSTSIGKTELATMPYELLSSAPSFKVEIKKLKLSTILYTRQNY